MLTALVALAHAIMQYSEISACCLRCSFNCILLAHQMLEADHEITMLDDKRCFVQKKKRLVDGNEASITNLAVSGFQYRMLDLSCGIISGA